MIFLFIPYFTILFAAYVLVTKAIEKERGTLYLRVGDRLLALPGMTPRTEGEIAIVLELAAELARDGAIEFCRKTSK